MIPVLSVEETRLAEKKAMEKTGEDEYIERAARSLYDFCLSLNKDGYAVFAGGGNNGSDALSLAALLINAGKRVKIYSLGKNKNEYNYKRLETLRRSGADLTALEDVSLIDLTGCEVIVDGLFGIGLSRPLEGLFRETVEYINERKRFVLSIDIPSGLNADNGTTDCAVRADVTVTFTSVKPGHLLGLGKNYTGRLLVKDVGIKPDSPGAYILEEEDVKLKRRLPASHKGNYGTVRIIAGSPEMMGASLLAHESALAALRCGAGYAVLCVPASLGTAYGTRVKEEMLCFLPDENGRIVFDEASLKKCLTADSIVIGPGLGNNPDLPAILEFLMKNYAGTLVIDADGLNALAADLSVAAGHICKLILTPHIGEYRRLTSSAKPVGIAGAKEFAKKLNAVLVVKSASTVITDGVETAINVTGSPCLAKGGSGDVLAGMIGAFAANYSPVPAAKMGCWYFGKAGEKAAERYGEHSVLASDVCGIIAEEEFF